MPIQAHSSQSHNWWPSRKNVRMKKVATGRKRSPRKLSSRSAAVKKAHEALCQILKEFHISQVERTYGTGIVRVSCRSVDQIESITTIVGVCVKYDLIQEVGFPSEFTKKMKSFVLFIKPVDINACVKLALVFKNCAYGYNYLVLTMPDSKCAVQEAASNEVQIANQTQLFGSWSDIFAKRGLFTRKISGIKGSGEKVFITFTVLAILLLCLFFQIFLRS